VSLRDTVIPLFIPEEVLPIAELRTGVAASKKRINRAVNENDPLHSQKKAASFCKKDKDLLKKR
jgi:hypothetical protein